MSAHRAHNERNGRNWSRFALSSTACLVPIGARERSSTAAAHNARVPAMRGTGPTGAAHPQARYLLTAPAPAAGHQLHRYARYSMSRYS